MFTLGSGGAISGSTSLLPGGTYPVHAHYAGNYDVKNGNFAASDSAPITVTVTAETSKTTLSGFDQNNNPITTANRVAKEVSFAALGTSGIWVSVFEPAL